MTTRTHGPLSPALLAAFCVACASDPISPPDTPFLAVVLSVDAAAAAAAHRPYQIVVHDLSGTTRKDIVLTLTAHDTAVLTVSPASYVLTISDVPATCGVRDGIARIVTVPAHSNTTVAHFSVSCRSAVTLVTLTDGNAIDSAFTYLVEGPGGSERFGAIASNDTVALDQLPPGQYSVRLGLVSPNCQVLDGSDRRSFDLTEAGGISLTFRVSCADPQHRPKIVTFKGSQHASTIGFYMQVEDPEHDVDRYFWDLTDCARHSRLPNGVRWRDKLRPFVASQEGSTVTIVGAFDVDLPADSFLGACQSIYVGDAEGNLSPIAEIPLRESVAHDQPVEAGFNAIYVGSEALRSLLQVDDPNGDYLGAFVVYEARDGTTGEVPDGRPDRLVFRPAGILGTVIPDLSFSLGVGQWFDYTGVTVVLVDAKGNVSQVEDHDLFR